MARGYPAAEDAWRAYQAAGLIYFRLEDWEAAVATWREMAQAPALPAFARPVAYYWLGRAHAASGKAEAALAAWQAAVQSGPDSFYGLRAAAWASGTASVQVSGGVAIQTPDLPGDAGDLADLTVWLRGWAGADRWPCHPRSSRTRIGVAGARC